MPTIAVRADVLLPEPLHVSSGEEIPGAVLLVRGRVERKVGHWVREQLPREWRPAGVRVPYRGHGREVPACTVACNDDPGGIPAEFGRGVLHPADGSQRIVGGRWKARLRSQPVIDGHHDRLHIVGDRPAVRIMAVEVTDHPATAVEERDEWQPVL